jgi:hypothetical protein
VSTNNQDFEIRIVKVEQELLDVKAALSELQARVADIGLFTVVLDD